MQRVLEEFFPEPDVKWGVSPGIVVGASVRWAGRIAVGTGSSIADGTRLGSGCVLGRNVVVGKDVEIGDSCRLDDGVRVRNIGEGFETDASSGRLYSR